LNPFSLFSLENLVEIIGPIWLIVGLVAMIALTIVLMIVRDARIAFVPFFIGILFVNTENRAVYMGAWVFRWLMLVILTIRALRPSTGRMRWTAGHTLYLLLTLVCFLFAFRAAHNKFRAFSFAVVMVFAFMAFFVLIAREAYSIDRVRRFMDLFVWIVLINIAMMTLVFLYSGGSSQRMSRRLSGFLENPNVMGRAIALGCPLLIWRALDVRGIGRKVFLVVMFLLGCTMVFLTGSRGSMLYVAVVVFFLLGRYHVKLAAPIGVFALLLVMVLLPYVREMPGGQRFVAHLTSVEGTGREELLRAAVDKISERPFTGYGTGAASDKFFRMTEPGSFHNAYADICVDLGVGGLLIWLALLFSRAWLALKLCSRRDPTGRVRQMGWLLLASYAGFIIYQMVEPSFVNVSTFAHYWLLAHLCLTGVLAKLALEERSYQEAPVGYEPAYLPLEGYPQPYPPFQASAGPQGAAGE